MFFNFTKKKVYFDFTKLFKIFSADNKENQQMETPELPHLNSYEANLMLSQKKVAGKYFFFKFPHTIKRLLNLVSLFRQNWQSGENPG